jgi:20S proteasome subunit beta 6
VPSHVRPLLHPSHSTVVAVAGHDYCIVAASTRLSTGYSILTREETKLCRL